MSVVDGKRITFKRTRPNPLFHDWLRELHVEAKQKGSKFESVLEEALSSLSKYPLPLQSGAECAILKGFDKRLCLFLDNRLEIHKRVNTECLSENLLESYSENSASDKNDGNPNENEQELQEINKSPQSINLSSPQTKNSRIKYRPAFRSGCYALLMVLIDLKKNQTISKGQLIAAAQKYCKEDIKLVWKNMTRLIGRGLVQKSGSIKPQFSLTEDGFLAAKDLFRNVQSKRGVDEDIFNDDSILNGCNKNSEIIIQKDTKRKLNDIDNVYVIPKNGTSNILDNCINSEVIPTIDINEVEDQTIDSDLIQMEPGSFDIILLIDKNETSGLTNKNDPTVAQFKKYPELKHEYRSLKVGDFTWIARNKANIDQELVLPHVVERKRMDDLGASIKDGRFHEQKFRLRKCGLSHVMYMVENHGRNKQVGLPMQSLMQALANTRVQDGFKVHITDSLSHSAKFLAMMTLRLTYEYKDKRLTGHNGEPKEDILMTFGYFNKSCKKNKPLSVTDMFIKLLLQLKGVSVEKALTITNVYKTPRSLIEAYESCDRNDGEMLLVNLKFGELNRSVGRSVSKSVYQLFTFRNTS